MACREYTKVCSPECDKNHFRILPCQQANRQRLVRFARDEYRGFPRKLGAESDVSETIDRHTYRTERGKNRCMYIQDKNKDNDGGNGSIRENESVTTVQNPQSPS